MVKRSLLLMTFIPLFTNCTGSTYSSHFDCPYGEGLGCASLSKVNQMIDQHQVHLNEGGPTRLKQKQLHIYYGPNEMSQLISIEEWGKPSDA